jgi:hypothetical protein
MSFDSRIGIASLIVGLLGIGITILFPNQKILGWLCIGLALLGGVGWIYLEVRPEGKKTEDVKATPAAPMPSVPKNDATPKRPASPHHAPPKRPDVTIRVLGSAVLPWPEEFIRPTVDGKGTRDDALAYMEVDITNEGSPKALIERHLQYIDDSGSMFTCEPFLSARTLLIHYEKWTNKIIPGTENKLNVTLLAPLMIRREKLTNTGRMSGYTLGFVEGVGFDKLRNPQGTLVLAIDDTDNGHYSAESKIDGINLKTLMIIKPDLPTP